MKVLVVELSNTGADTAAELVGHAKKIYVSHRAGHKLVKQFIYVPVSIDADRYLAPSLRRRKASKLPQPAPHAPYQVRT
jgi:hypothetical protein